MPAASCGRAPGEDFDLSSVRQHRKAGLFISLIIILFSFSPPVRDFLSLPPSTRIVVGDRILIKVPFSVRPRVIAQVMQPDQEEGRPPAVNVSYDGQRFSIIARRPGTARVSLKLWGLIPFKTLTVETLPSRRVVVGGHSIGILLQSRGIMVVGMAPISSSSGEKYNPAREAGIHVGDRILKIDGRPVYTEKALAEHINRDGMSGVTPKFVIQRKQETVTIRVKPAYCPETQRYRIGLYVRDGVAGVGTLTFFEPETKRFAALGHVIVDSDTRQVVSLRQGRIVEASIQAVQPGRPGHPGQKIGVFARNSRVLGTIKANCVQGIFGTAVIPIKNPLYPSTIPVAYAYQVRPGPAQMLTVVNRDKIEKYNVVIERVYPYRRSGKGMIIRVTDRRLLKISGGIVQGMSGSPLVQNGYLVGAVTHVFLSNPQKGYATFMDSMLQVIKNQDITGETRQTASSVNYWAVMPGWE